MTEEQKASPNTPESPEAPETEETPESEEIRSDDPEHLARLLEDARNKADDHWNQVLRARAELENVRRRHDKELEKAHKFALESFVKELIQVWDSLELGLQAAQGENPDVEKLREGMELTLKLLTDVMRRFGVEQVAPQPGDPFDHEFQQAMTLQPRDDMEPNHVVQVIQKGYTLNGRLLRPALVIVSQAPA